MPRLVAAGCVRVAAGARWCSSDVLPSACLASHPCPLSPLRLKRYILSPAGGKTIKPDPVKSQEYFAAVNKGGK